MRCIGLAFLVLAFTGSAGLAQVAPPLLLCKVDGVETRDGAGMRPHDGNYLVLEDRGDAIAIKVDNHRETLPIVDRRNGWLLTAERSDNGGTTTLRLVNMPEFDGLTMFQVLATPLSRMTLKGRCKPN